MTVNDRKGFTLDELNIFNDVCTVVGILLLQRKGRLTGWEAKISSKAEQIWCNCSSRSWQIFLFLRSKEHFLAFENVTEIIKFVCLMMIFRFFFLLTLWKSMLNNRSASTSRCPQMELIHKVIKKTEEEKKILETPLSANDLFLKQSFNGCSCWIASAWFVKKPMTKYIW